ncbi:hypothetical protein WN48_02983 [Eufriesea mexicana]|uniref:Uncharacterized protein n=1 Tax=Eufriesea mexicana TaxID=516756 RepID=A0A310SCX6_9HYME|nr:hypothetical protein WN48_02983 [Eufriesea mexicana]
MGPVVLDDEAHRTPSTGTKIEDEDVPPVGAEATIVALRVALATPCVNVMKPPAKYLDTRVRPPTGEDPRNLLIYLASAHST